MQLSSPLSTAARPFQPQAASPSALLDDTPRGPGAVASLLVSLWEVHASAITTPLMRKVCPLITLSPRSHFAGGVVAEGVRVAGVVVTPIGLPPPARGGRKRTGSLARSKSLNLEARRAILMMWSMPLGSGFIVSLIIMTTMRIPTSCP